MTDKKQFVHVHIDFVLDMSRDFEGTPHEMSGVESNIGGVIAVGLRRYLPRRSNVKLLPGTFFRMRTLSLSQLVKSRPRAFAQCSISPASGRVSGEKVKKQRQRKPKRRR